MFKTLVNAWKIQELKNKIIFTIVIVLLYRIGASVPVPYINAETLQTTFQSMSDTMFGYLNLLSGQAFSQATLFALSVSPYITAQIVVQLLTIAIPALEKLSKEGEEGRKKINKITSYLTVALALVTSYGYYAYMRNMGILTDNGGFAAVVIIACYCAGASLIMWLAQKIDEKGIGNGISIILFVNILATGYATLQTILGQFQSGDALKIIFGVLSIIIMVGIIVLIVFITNSERRIKVQYAKRVVGRKMYGGQESNLPLKLNMAGVMPIIFANSIVALPSTIALFARPKEGSFWESFLNLFSTTSIVYILLFLVLIIAFAYFYISISFNHVEVANNMKKNGGFIPGIRPGKPTADSIKTILNRITLIGAIFLAIIAGIPLLVNMLAPGYLGALAFGGSSLLIVVGVALETARELESQMAMRHYKGFLG